MRRERAFKKKKHWILREYPLHLMLIPGILIVFVFSYLPMFGLVMTFQNFNPMKSFTGSEFVGLRYFGIRLRLLCSKLSWGSCFLFCLLFY